MLKRSMLRAIERQVALHYTGTTWDELVTEEPVLAELELRRSYGRQAGETEELGAYLVNALADKPAVVLAWLERSFARPDSFASRMLPELRVLIGSEKPIREDDTSFTQLTYRLGLNSEDRLHFAAVLEVTRGRANSAMGELHFVEPVSEG